MNVTALTIHVLIDWDNAPPWAQFVTVDKRGAVEVHESEPEEEDGFWVRGGFCEVVGNIQTVKAAKFANSGSAEIAL